MNVMSTKNWATALASLVLTAAGNGNGLADTRLEPPRSTASSSADGSIPGGAVDGDRFSTSAPALWRGRPEEHAWWWQLEFPEPRALGAILQVHGDHPFAMRNTPRRYVWRISQDGKTWEDLPETATENERRMFRIHRLKEARRARWVRCVITTAEGDSPTLREVEFLADPHSQIAFPPWSVAVSTTTESSKVPGEGGRMFRSLARSCVGWEHLEFQNVWMGDFDPAFLKLEPRPLCAFLSGNFRDWCQQDRECWRGVAEVLRERAVPLWASCGGAQGLAILTETGIDKPWDCPQCRDPAHPLLPIYTHVAGSAKRACGDYSACVFERGRYTIRRLVDDPVFRGLPRDFPVIESHCGQIEWPPEGWELIATRGPGGKTKTQCLRLKDQLIYAAQFHIELDGTPDTSKTIMTNFLSMCQGLNAKQH